MIRDPSFSEHELCEQTKKLVIRFSKALVPLFRPPHDSGEILSAIWVSSERTVGTLFKTALNFKAAIVATGQQYEFVVYPPGTRAAKTTPMDEDLNILEQSRKEFACEAWQHASLYVYEAEPSSRKNEVTDVAAKPENFVLQEADMREKKSCLYGVLTISKGMSTKLILTMN